MQPIVFNKAGKFMLNKYVNGRPVKSIETSLFRNGVVQSITPSININGTPITDGNSLWNAMHIDTSIEGSVAVQLAFMPPELYAFIMGDKTEELVTADFPVIDEEIIVPDIAPYTVELSNIPNAGGALIVDVDGKALQPATANEEEEIEITESGEYILEDGEMTFHESDAGKLLYVTYDYEAKEVTKFGLPKNPKREAYQLVISGEATGEDERLYNTALIIDKAKVTGDINPPAQGGEPAAITITFTVLKPRGNNRAVDYMATPMKQ